MSNVFLQRVTKRVGFCVATRAASLFFCPHFSANPSFALSLSGGVWHFGGVLPAQRRFWPDPQPLVECLGQSFFQRLPEAPGVYLMHGADEAVLYVGKAKSLRHRLGSYRVANPDRMPRRTLRLLRLVRRIAWEEHADEQAALRRESELLLNLKPRFNRAGVWQGPKRFLVWRALPEGLALTVATLPETGWSFAGPFGAQVFSWHRVLLRLLWLRFQPQRGLVGMPAGWFRGRQGNQVTIPAADDSLIGQAAVQLNRLFDGAEVEFQRWLADAPPASPFEMLCWQEDIQSVCESPVEVSHA